MANLPGWRSRAVGKFPQRAADRAWRYTGCSPHGCNTAVSGSFRLRCRKHPTTPFIQMRLQGDKSCTNWFVICHSRYIRRPNTFGIPSSEIQCHTIQLIPDNPPKGPGFIVHLSNLPPFLPLFYGSGCMSRSGTRVFTMAKAIAVCALCIASAAVGAGTDRYFGAAIEEVLVELIHGPHLQQAVSPKAAVAATAEMNVEVLGDRVRCDVRYQELKISPSEYQAFKRKCMGEKYSDDD